MMDKYTIDPELAILKPLKFTKYSKMRLMIANGVFLFTMFFSRPRRGIRVKKYKIHGFKHQLIKVLVFEMKNQKEKAPGLLYIHGGGFQITGTPVHVKMVTNLMVETGHKVVFIQYRLAPKHPFPTGLEDCYHALSWMKEHADYLNIDGNDISVAGDSAGGNLSIGVSLLSRDRKGPEIKKMLLLYPVVDVRQQTESIRLFTDTPMWNSQLNKSMWNTYLKNGHFNMLSYASPSLAEVKGLPKTYIETAEFDCLRDEGIEFGTRLFEAGIDVRVYHTLGTVHGYDAVFFSDLVKGMNKERVAFLKGDI
jgi:acetyl esterase